MKSMIDDDYDFPFNLDIALAAVALVFLASCVGYLLGGA